MDHIISSQHITFDQIKSILQPGTKLVLGDEAVQRIRKCREYLDQKLDGSAADPVFVIGSLAQAEPENPVVGPGQHRQRLFNHPGLEQPPAHSAGNAFLPAEDQHFVADLPRRRACGGDNRDQGHWSPFLERRERSAVNINIVQSRDHPD